jgi:hypothetical protein
MVLLNARLFTVMAFWATIDLTLVLMTDMVDS